MSGAPLIEERDTAPARPPVVVDVIVNNHNYEAYLGLAIRSALEQTYEHVNVIVVDDGSTDGSLAVVESFGDRIVPVLKENGGQGSAFNAGLERSRGDVVVFLDADDTLAPEAAARIADAFRRRPDLAKVHYRLAVVDADGRPTGAVDPAAHIPLPHGDLRDAMVRFPFDVARPATSGNAFSAEVLRAIAPVPSGTATAADWYVVYLAALHGPVGAIDEPLGSYRIHGANWHVRGDGVVDLGHLRRTIVKTGRARRYVEEASAALGLPVDPRDASMCEIADRAISKKLDPSRHPVEGDTLPKLVATGLRAARRRFDVRPPLRIAYGAWLVLLSVSPRPLAGRLAEAYAFSGRRSRLGRWLTRQHRRG